MSTNCDCCGLHHEEQWHQCGTCDSVPHFDSKCHGYVLQIERVCWPDNQWNLCLFFAVHLAVKSTIDLTIGGAKIVHYTGDFVYMHLASTSYWQINLGDSCKNHDFALVVSGSTSWLNSRRLSCETILPSQEYIVNCSVTYNVVLSLSLLRRIFCRHARWQCLRPALQVPYWPARPGSCVWRGLNIWNSPNASAIQLWVPCFSQPMTSW